MAGLKRGRSTEGPSGQPEGPRGVWIIGGREVNGRYPCRCNGSRPCGRRCWCWGRVDYLHMPKACCSWRAAGVEPSA